MKKVRFESPLKFSTMTEAECESPRPLIGDHAFIIPPEIQEYTRILPYNSDPAQRFECSNSMPYPTVNKTHLSDLLEKGPKCLPSNELDLSLFDASCYETKAPSRPILKIPERIDTLHQSSDYNFRPALSTVHNQSINSPNILMKDNSFFIRRNNNRDLNCTDNGQIYKQFGRLSLGKENYPLAKKGEFINNMNSPECIQQKQPVSSKLVSIPATQTQYCSCHYCVKTVSNEHCLREKFHCYNAPKKKYCQCCLPKPNNCTHCDHKKQKPPICNFISEQSGNCTVADAVDQKTLAIKRYEENAIPTNTEIVPQNNVLKEKCEPTVADLFKIIKHQNEQLQLLQEKVDKFIYATEKTQQCSEPKEMLQNTEHKISIGVMTSFEVVQTSTVINKEIFKQTNENAQIQCNRSQISIKEVISKAQPTNINFLDGLTPPSNLPPPQAALTNSNTQNNGNEEKILNENSLYNVQVDNATTPFMSPEPSMYLDVRDYSESDASNDDQSNLGWTYYNKVMTHVNGILQDSDIPSSASALYRNARQCVQMHIDKTNVSVTKRVKFGDDPLGLHQPHIYTALNDTSLKMNQLAAKYLKGQPTLAYKEPVKPTTPEPRPADMSIATRNYMERYKLLEGTPKSPTYEMPRFLDITALKQQPKLM